MRAWTLKTCLLLVLAGSALPALAWEPETRARMTDEAVRLMPESLKLALQAQREALLRGMLTPTVREDQPEHRPPWAEGTLDQRLDTEIAALVEALGKNTQFATLAERFGAVAHYVMDAGFPPGMTDSNGTQRYKHFSEFCESRRERFPLVFYGHDAPELQRGDIGAYTRSIMQRARNEDRQLSISYAAAGDPPNPAAFDDRSVPFAVGSLSYSHTFTDIVRVWLAVWERGNGDMGRTPYLHRSKREAPRPAEAPDH
jgi:hypothetical protein